MPQIDISAIDSSRNLQIRQMKAKQREQARLISDMELKQELEREGQRITSLHNQISQVNQKRMSRTNTKSPGPISKGDQNAAENVAGDDQDKQMRIMKANQRK